MLVTGASRGIGAATARAFAARGDRVAVHYHRAGDRAAQVLADLPGAGHVSVAGDVADPDAVEALVAAAEDGLGGIDVLVNNAATFFDVGVTDEGAQRRLSHRLDEVDYDSWRSAWRRTLAVNLLGTADVSYCVARRMIAAGTRGRIVNIGSRGAFRGEPDVPAYGASKAGVHTLGQSLALVLAPYGIAVTSVAPGFVATDMAAGVLDGPAGDAVRAQSPFGRVAEPDEVAAAVVWLASPEAQWASGAVLDLNGASYLRT